MTAARTTAPPASDENAFRAFAALWAIASLFETALIFGSSGGLRIVHWGDNRQNPPEHIWDWIGDIDVVFLAVSDDGHILSPKWADVIVEKLGPAVVIPAHYYINGIGVPHAGGLEPALEWTKTHQHTLLESHTLTLSPETVARYDRHVFYFGEHVPFAVTGTPPQPQEEMPPVPEPARAWERFEH